MEQYSQAMSKFEKMSEQIDCAFCKKMYPVHQMIKVAILIGCCDISERMICKSCYQNPVMEIRRIENINMRKR